MITIQTAAAIRRAEDEYFTAHPETDLMQLAATVVADTARTMLGPDLASARLLLLCGAGNNGGDGLFAVSQLRPDGARVWILPVFGKTHPDGTAAALAAGCQLVDLVQAAQLLADCDLVIDAVTGIGGRAGLPESLRDLSAELADLQLPLLAVDLPSGLDADSHAVTECFVASTTITFAAPKTCHVAAPARDVCGAVLVADIGLGLAGGGVRQAEPADIARMWPTPDGGSDKFSRGVVGMDTGSVGYPGAGVLGVLGALHAGAGMVRCVGPQPVADLVIRQAPSVVTAEGRVQAWVCGSGWGTDSQNLSRLRSRLADGVRMVLDADAIALLAMLGPDEVPGNCLITPHAGELARLLDLERSEVESDPIRRATSAAERFGCTVLLKGATHYVVSSTGQVTLAVAGPAWTAQAGSGDVLAGICGSLLAAGLPAPDAAILGASIQALTSSRMPGPHPPDVMARAVSDTVAAFRGSESVPGGVRRL